MADAEFDLKELCSRTRVTPRTVHFYVQQGLLPPAGSPGPGARYGEGHVARLRLIRLMQKQHLPLAEIGKRLRGLSDAQAATLVAEAKGPRREATRENALEYIRGLLSESPPAVPALRAAASAPLRLPGAGEMVLGSITFQPDAEPAAGARSQWDRIALAEGIELHVQRPLTRELRRRLDRLLAAAREIFEEEP